MMISLPGSDAIDDVFFQGKIWHQSQSDGFYFETYRSSSTVACHFCMLGMCQTITLGCTNNFKNKRDLYRVAFILEKIMTS